MTTRRIVSITALGMLASALAPRRLLAQSDRQQDQTTLRNRGAPAGRVGAATRTARGGEEELTLDLVAPMQGIGLTSSDQPTLCYLLSGSTGEPLRLAVSMRGQARPLADLELQRPRDPAGLGVVDLHGRNVRLAPNQLYVWSVALLLDPRAPSRDLVASALIQYQPADPAYEKMFREAPVEQRYARLARRGYWYDAVALAVADRARDGGSALTELLRQAELRIANGQTDRAGGATNHRYAQ